MAAVKMKPDLDRLGIFKEMSYHTIKDPYVESQFERLGSRHRGRQILIGGRKLKSALPDGYFTEFKRIFAGDNKLDIVSVMRKQRNLLKKRNIGKDWIPGVPSKPISSSGSSYGTFSGPLSHFRPTSIKQSSSRVVGRNIITCPGKKGPGSYVDVTINPYPKHSVDQYDLYEKLRRKELISERIQIHTKGPFYTRIHSSCFFDPNPYHVKNARGRSHSAPPRQQTAKWLPFKPSSPAKLDGGCKDGCFDPFPSYQSDRPRGEKPSFRGSPFHFATCPLPYPIASIVSTNVKRSVNSSNYKQVKAIVYA
ncbi:hypothetical protein PHET_07075 [Paragonimus heterotremus]|uniref:Cilia-and flagella-associated protein 96 n=1 Tax=Paragonimus heterotremus TaxID=100268 RepID=A0A8J4T829_9TREM|nr:hypothetical protein PHET_07075 [Paragonimus heterotremus]